MADAHAAVFAEGVDGGVAVGKLLERLKGRREDRCLVTGMLDAVEPEQQGEVLLRPFLAGRFLSRAWAKRQ